MTPTKYSEAYQSGFDLTVRLLISRGVPYDDAEETAQAAWSRGWERAHQLRNEECVATWVNAIALNLYRRSVRRESRNQPLLDLSGGTGVDLASIDLSRVMNWCAPAERLLLLYQLNGLTVREIANKIGATELAARLRMMRARRAAKSAGERLQWNLQRESLKAA